MRKTCALLLLLGVILRPQPLAAAEAEGGGLRLDPINITARGYASPQSQTPGGVGVILEEDLTQAPQSSLADALERLPGVNRSGDSPWGQDISIRGLSGPSVILLIDGKRLHTATDINARLGFLNPADIERVEVLKGPVSALYGSGSIGGVVNIITRKPDFTDAAEAHGKIAASGATNPSGGGIYGAFSLSGPAAAAFVSGAFRDYGDLYGGDKDRMENSSFMDRQGRASLGLRPWRPLTLRLEAMRSTGSDIGLPGGPASMPPRATVTYTHPEFTLFGLDADLELDGPYLKNLEGDLYYTKNKRRVLVSEAVRPAGGAWPIEARPAADHETWGGKLQSRSEFGGHTLSAGLDFWLWRVESERYRRIQLPAPNNQYRELYDSPIPDARQLSLGLFAEDNWKLNQSFTLNLGARLDRLNTRAESMVVITPNPNALIYQNSREIYGKSNENDWGWHGHAGLTWNMSSSWSQSLLLSSGYRAADIMERFKYISLGGIDIYGNPELKPERSWHAEYGLRFDGELVNAELRLFADIIGNYIAEKASGPTQRRLENVAAARIYGAELEARWQCTQYLALLGNMTWLYGEDRENKEPLPGVAPLSGLAGLEITPGYGFRARLDGRFIARQSRAPKGVAHTPGAATLNASLGYAFEAAGFAHDISLAGDNLLDASYHNYLAHERGQTLWEPGIAVRVNYSLSF